MVIRAFIMFVLLGPLVELAVAVFAVSRLGLLPTLLVIIGTSVLGMALIRSEGIAALRGVQRDLQRGIPPSLGLMIGVLRVLGAVLLAIPGLVTSVIGLLLLLPPVRVFVAPVVVAWMARRASASVARMRMSGLVVGTFPGGGAGLADHRNDAGMSGDVIDADGWDVEEHLILPPPGIDDRDGDDPFGT